MINQSNDELIKLGLNKLLKIKDSDIRILTLKQGYQAVDHGIHSGGAFSVTIPMISLFYGGFLNLDMDDPARVGQDMFVLSKGHAVATMASIYTDLGYFNPSLLENSRSVESILNGHPGPLLPGVHLATGPLGQGLAAAQGFAMAGKSDPEFNVFCITGDGELQEGVVWEAIMHAPQRNLDNLCVIVDKNEGQLDNHAQLIFPMDNLPDQFKSFGWKVMDIDGTSYSDVMEAIGSFASFPKVGRPTAIICNSKKGFGSFSQDLNKHKVTLSTELYEQEMTLQTARRNIRAKEYLVFHKELIDKGRGSIASDLLSRAEIMNLAVDLKAMIVSSLSVPFFQGKVPIRDKSVKYNADSLPVYKMDAHVAASDVISICMSEFARDPRVMSVDSDLGSTSGLEKGIGKVDESRGINIGIAESNMMCVGEAYAALGFNAWVSTFCPFFDWKVLRRIAVSAQERKESMASANGWLSEGHGLDLTFLATAPNFETKTNGATHMGNDDTLIFDAIAGLKIIDVSCPNQLVGIMRWIMEGNKGLNYLRIMRAASDVIYSEGYEFEYAKAYLTYGDASCNVRFVSSGRGVHEALTASKILEEKGVTASVYDMPSFDEKKMAEFLVMDGLTVVAEHNNGFLWNRVGRMLLNRSPELSLRNCICINANNPDGTYRYLHSATYEQLLEDSGLNPNQMALAVIDHLKK